MLPPELDFTEEERELLRSAELDQPAPGAKTRALAALGLGGAVVGGAVVSASAQAATLAAAQGGAVATAGASAGKSLVVAKWLLLLAASGAAGGAALHYRAAAEQATVAAPARPLPPRAAPLENPPPVAAQPPQLAPAPKPDKAPAGAAVSRTEPNLALEIEALDRARRASERGDFGKALSELDGYERSFKQGSLRQEALLLRVQTLIGKGDTAGARALGQRFLARYPKSPLSPRIQKLIGGGP